MHMTLWPCSRYQHSFQSFSFRWPLLQQSEMNSSQYSWSSISSKIIIFIRVLSPSIHTNFHYTWSPTISPPTSQPIPKKDLTGGLDCVEIINVAGNLRFAARLPWEVISKIFKSLTRIHFMRHVRLYAVRIFFWLMRSITKYKHKEFRAMRNKTLCRKNWSGGCDEGILKGWRNLVKIKRTFIEPKL